VSELVRESVRRSGVGSAEPEACLRRAFCVGEGSAKRVGEGSMVMSKDPVPHMVREREGMPGMLH